MRDVMKDILVALLGAWLLERLPKVALAIVRLAAQLMPTPELRNQMRDDWTADIMTADGPLSMLTASIFTLVSVPNIRQGYGYRAGPISLDLDEIALKITNFAIILGLSGFLLSQTYMLVCRNYILPTLAVSKQVGFATSLSELSSITSIIFYLTLANASLHRAFLRRIRKRAK